ncbi:phosphotransferase family enzyme [Krasilnikovia cinnamomea]|uniref:Phosphotransferase family enzyme n=1 Tax=Krasilnikovia cinnamomea TaxID=349313 RepID=A0A4Q7ZQ87_9ACTN|nr:phosphotransferase [Krasilnikovia cinnamomea]RZU52703.1 phosphotransferase family enzyme [Krasilnikovia cinnamomea]
MNASPMPPADVDVSLDLVHRLVADQMPDLADRRLRMLAHGWDNVMVRIGDELIAPRTPPADHGEAARALAAFLAALHVPAPDHAPRNPVRGIPLAGRAARLADNLDRLGTRVDGHTVTRVFRAAAEAPAWDGAPVWLHGDLHPANILVHGGRVSAVIDFGDITAGDPATDLAVAWMLLPADEHRAFWGTYAAASQHPADGALRIRAHGWALALSVAFLAHSADNPLMAGIGRRTLNAVMADVA